MVMMIRTIVSTDLRKTRKNNFFLHISKLIEIFNIRRLYQENTFFFFSHVNIENFYEISIIHQITFFFGK